MEGDLICMNGRAVRPSDIGLGLDGLLSCNFVYQKMHVEGRRLWHAPVHAEIIGTAYKTLYGETSGVTAAILEKEVATLTAANSYPPSANLTALYLIPPGQSGGEPLRVLSCESQMLYGGYVMWHSGLAAIIVSYEYPFSPFRTAVSLSAHTYAAGYARRHGAEIALAENYAGVLTSAGEYPLYAVTGNTVLTTPIEYGAADSLERLLCEEACDRAGVTLLEEPLRKSDLADYDELFTVNPQGIVSIRSCQERLMTHSMAMRIAAGMGGVPGGH